MHVGKLLHGSKHTIDTISDRTKVGEVIKEFFDKKVNALLVTDNGNKLVGLVAERDIVRAMGEHGRKAADIPVSDIMAVDLVVCEPETGLQEALKMMADHKVRHLPVVTQSGHMFGILSVVEVAKALMDEDS